MELSCPQCGLKLAMRGPRHEYCPRCIANRGQPVPLVASSLFKRDTSDGAGTSGGDPPTSSAPANVAAMRARHAF